MYVLEWRTVPALTRGLLGAYFPSCEETREINTEITLEWAQRQFVNLSALMQIDTILFKVRLNIPDMSQIRLSLYMDIWMQQILMSVWMLMEMITSKMKPCLCGCQRLLFVRHDFIEIFHPPNAHGSELHMQYSLSKTCIIIWVCVACYMVNFFTSAHSRCQMSEWLEKFKPESPGFETSLDKFGG